MSHLSALKEGVQGFAWEEVGKWASVALMASRG